MNSSDPDHISCSICGMSLWVKKPEDYEPIVYYKSDLVFEIKAYRKNFKRVWSDDKKRVVQAHTGTETLRLCGQCLHALTEKCESSLNPNYPL